MKFTCFRILFTIVVFALVFSITSGADIFALDKKYINPQSKTDIRAAQPEDDDEADARNRIDDEEQEEEENDSEQRRRHEEDEEEEPDYKYPMEEETEEYEKDRE